MWQIESTSQPKINQPVALIGLPGIGNVGKIAIDFIVDELRATSIASFFSPTLPHTVFVNEKNTVELPRLELLHKKIGKTDLLFLAGDVQPPDAQSCHSFCSMLLDMFKKYNTRYVITTGGLGYQEPPQHSRLLITGTSQKIITSFSKGVKVVPMVDCAVAPIIGVTGLCVGLAPKYGLEAVCVLAETLMHPLYFEVKGAKELVKLLDKKLGLGVDVKKMEREVTRVERRTMQRVKELQAHQHQETNYIG